MTFAGSANGRAHLRAICVNIKGVCIVKKHSRTLFLTVREETAFIESTGRSSNKQMMVSLQLRADAFTRGLGRG